MPKINWICEVVGIAPGETERNKAHARSLGLPYISVHERPKLAVVGGGPSVLDFKDELAEWDGDVWVSGSAFPLISTICKTPTFFTIDQSTDLAKDGKGAKKAILATCCNPSVFEVLKDAEIEIFDIFTGGPNSNHHATTITAAPKVGLDMGYRDITFFGCEGSFMETTHAYETTEINDKIIVKCNGQNFVTRPSFLLQCEFMARVVHINPRLFKVRGEGLLTAMVKDLDYDITHAQPELARRILKDAA